VSHKLCVSFTRCKRYRYLLLDTSAFQLFWKGNQVICQARKRGRDTVYVQQESDDCDDDHETRKSWLGCNRALGDIVRRNVLRKHVEINDFCGQISLNLALCR